MKNCQYNYLLKLNITTTATWFSFICWANFRMYLQTTQTELYRTICI